MTDVISLPSLRETIATFGLQAKKSLGQNFILDENITDKIARLANISADVPVLEIGPGPGGLTRSLLKTAAPYVLAIERDDRCLKALATLESAAKGRLRLMAADALKIELNTLEGGPFDVVANLPYNIGTRLLLMWCCQKNHIRRMTLMFQKEVAERLIAKPGEAAYGSLSVWIQWQMEAQILLTLPPQVFSPAPKVMSAVVQLVPRSVPLHPADPLKLQKVLATAFQQRRKMLRRSLRTLEGYTEDWFACTGISPDARPETLTIADFCRLSHKIDDKITSDYVTSDLINE